jgi:hypothetical protein
MFFDNLNNLFLILKITVFWNVVLYSRVHHCWRFEGRSCLHLQGIKVNQAWKKVVQIQREEVSDPSLEQTNRNKNNSTKNEEVGFLRYNAMPSGESQQTTWCYIPEDRTFHSHCCENLRPNSVKNIWPLKWLFSKGRISGRNNYWINNRT